MTQQTTYTLLGNIIILKNNKIMKQQVRKGIFETNSSSTHTLSLYNKKEWEKLRNRNDVWLDFYGKREIITREQIENSKSYKKFVANNYPDFDNLNDSEKQDVLKEYLEEESLYDIDTLTDRFEVLTVAVPDSEYIAVSLFSED